MQEDGTIIINVKFPDCGNVIQPILLACMKLRWLTLEIEKLIDKVSLDRTESSVFTKLQFSFGRSRGASSLVLGITRGTMAYN